MRWDVFNERISNHEKDSQGNFIDVTFVKDLITDYTEGNMEEFELYNCLNKIHAIDNIHDYFNSVNLNSYDKNLLRTLKDLNDTTSLEEKYIKYSDTAYLYSARPFILLPVVKQELADLVMLRGDEKATRLYFERHNYDFDAAIQSGFSRGTIEKDLEMFIEGWTETARYLQHLVDRVKSILLYFENGLHENEKAIRQFFYDYAYTFDFSTLVLVYETYIKYHNVTDEIANDISEHYKRLKPMEFEKLSFTNSEEEKEDVFDVESSTYEEVIEEQDKNDEVLRNAFEYLKHLFD